MFREYRVIPGSVRARVALAALLVMLLATLVGRPLVPADAAPGSRKMPDLETAKISDLQGAMDSGRVSSVDLVRAYEKRIEALNTDGPGLNAVRALNPDALREAGALDRERRRGNVRGPLHGIPVLIKDNVDIAGQPTTAGSLALEDSVPPSDASVTKRLREAGAVVLGKTNLTEFANFTTSGMPSGYSSLGGQVLNPYDASQTPSGSSSGSAAAAAGLAAATVGTETSGSILSPAVANSLAGVKPTVGLVSRTGIIPISATQDTAGPMARNVADAAALLSGMTGRDPEDEATLDPDSEAGTDYTEALSDTALQGARIGVPQAGLSGDQAAAFEAVTAELTRQGATVVPVAPVNTSGLAPSILTYEFKRDLNAYLDRLPEAAPMDSLADIIAFNEQDPASRAKFGQTQLVASEAVDLEAERATYEANREAGLTESRSRIDGALAANDLDALLYPGSSSAGIGARAGYPSVTVPAGYLKSNNRPFGITLLGTAWSEDELLGLAYDYEQASQLWQPPSEINPSLFRCTTLQTPTRPEETSSCAP